MSDTPTPAQLAYEAWVRSKENPPMPDTPTPGQVAYEAFVQRVEDHPAFAWSGAVEPWYRLTPLVQDCWDAAAQAVLTAAKEEQA